MKYRKEQQEINQSVAETILEQLGGNRFRVMTGAKDFMAIDYGLQFRIPATLGKNQINSIRVELSADDTYKMTFYSVRGGKVKERHKASGLYNDMIEREFKEATGLNTRLF